VAIAYGASALDRLHPFSASDPASESVRAGERIFDEVGLDAHVGIVALVDLPADPDAQRSQDRVDDVARRIFLERGIGFVASYYTTGDRSMVSRDGSQAFVVAHFETLSDRRQQLAAERVRERFAGDSGVSFGGEAPGNVDVTDIVAEDIARAELIAFPLLFALGFWFFRGLVAALLPLAIGAVATAVALASLRIINELVDVSVFALNLVLGLVLALSIDYTLLIVSRYREELARDRDPERALAATMGRAGRTVLFSSTAIAAAMAALLVFPQRFLYSMGIGGIVVGIAAGAAALLVLPALLSVLGARVNAGAPGRLQRIAARQAKPEAEGGWYRLARFVMRRPTPVAAACAVFLIALGIPFLSARYTPVDTTVLPDGTESREVREALESDFPANLSLPLFAVLDGMSEREAAGVAAEIRELSGVARADAPRRVVGVQVIDISPRAGPRAEPTQRLVEEIRDLRVPGELLLGGLPADYADQQDSIAAHLPLALAILVIPTVVVLFAMTGSVLLPLKAVLMNVVSITAAVGLLVLIFQEGRLEGLLAYDSLGALDLAQPLVLLAVAWGISTDYGVFLLARIKEARDAGQSNDEAVALGLERTGRVLTAAALMFCVAIAAFATSQIVFIKELGLGLAAAVLIDATIVRALLVPSLMALLGRWNWWAPGPLRRLHTALSRLPRRWRPRSVQSGPRPDQRPS
jgi:RND superfamily putative drug exporter